MVRMLMVETIRRPINVSLLTTMAGLALASVVGLGGARGWVAILIVGASLVGSVLYCLFGGSRRVMSAGEVWAGYTRSGNSLHESVMACLPESLNASVVWNVIAEVAWFVMGAVATWLAVVAFGWWGVPGVVVVGAAVMLLAMSLSNRAFSYGIQAEVEFREKTGL